MLPHLYNLPVRIRMKLRRKSRAISRAILWNKPPWLVPHATRVTQRLRSRWSRPPLRRLIRSTVLTLPPHGRRRNRRHPPLLRSSSSSSLLVVPCPQNSQILPPPTLASCLNWRIKLSTATNHRRYRDAYVTTAATVVGGGRRRSYRYVLTTRLEYWDRTQLFPFSHFSLRRRDAEMFRR